MKAKLFLFLLGIVLGIALALFAPRFWHGLLPQEWRGEPTEGEVQAKRWDGDRLLLTLVTADGAVLATFTERVDEIELLVEPGDTVALALDGYRPFVDNPEIGRVVKATAPADSPAVDGGEPSAGSQNADPAEPLPAEREPAAGEPGPQEPQDAGGSTPGSASA